MNAVLVALALLAPSRQAGNAYYAVPVAELQLAPGQVLPRYAGAAPWEQWSSGVESLPWAALDGEGEALVRIESAGGRAGDGELEHALGVLVARTSQARELTGTLFLPRASGEGFLRLAFRVPAARATASEKDFQVAELDRCRWFLRLRLPGGAWFRHRHDGLVAALGSDDPASSDLGGWNAWTDFRDLSEALELFSGGRALSENLQLERGLPPSAEGEAKVALDSLSGIEVRALDWKELLAPGETALDHLAALIPADQHGVFFPSFESFTDVLDEADRLGTFGLSVFEERSSDALTQKRTERQLALELSALARTFGPLVVESVALTGSDPYLRTGSDLALIFRSRTPEVVRDYVALRQAAAPGEHVTGSVAGVEYRGVVDPARTVSSYLAEIGGAVVITNSRVQLERLARTAAGEEPALAAADEYRFFRQRYALGAEGESAFLVLTDAAIRRWCSPRWRIACARIARAGAELAEEHAAHLAELFSGEAGDRELGTDPAFPGLGALSLAGGVVRSSVYGTLDFQTPIAELPLERVTEREAELYRTWRTGYEQAWSNFFDPIGARLSVSERRTALDLTVMPLILGTEYADLREATQGPGLGVGSGDPHAEALFGLVLALNPEWEALKSVGSTLGAAGEKLGADPLSWLGGWLALYADEGPIWDELLQAEDVEEAFESVQTDIQSLPLAVVIAVRSPLKLALFLTSLRAFVDGTAPGMTDWKERIAGERRFVEITSPGLGESFSLFYATTPTALILSLREATLLAAMEREEARRAGGAAAPAPWIGAHAGLTLNRRGFEVLEILFEGEVAAALRRDSWRNLPVLNEWKRLHPELADPVALHERVFRERLTCPGGGGYTWDADWQTMESSVFGHPGEPAAGIRRPRAWDDLRAASFALTFERDGLRVRAEIERE